MRKKINNSGSSGQKKSGQYSIIDVAANSLTLPKISPKIRDTYSLPTESDVAVRFAELLSYEEDLTNFKIFNTRRFKRLWEKYLEKYNTEAFKKVFPDCYVHFLTKEETDDGPLADHGGYFDNNLKNPYAIYIHSNDNGPEYFRILDLITDWENENPGLGKLALHLLTYCPFDILTPETLKEYISSWHWQGEPDDSYRIAELLDNDVNPDEIEDYLITCKEFHSYFPEWMCEYVPDDFQFQFELPEVVKQLKDAHDHYEKVRDKRKYIDIPYLNYELTGVVLMELEQNSGDMIDRVLNDINEIAWSSSGSPNVSAYVIVIDMDNVEQSADYFFRELDAVFRYAAAAAELLFFLHNKLQPKEMINGN